MRVRTLAWVKDTLEASGELLEFGLGRGGEREWVGATVDSRGDCRGRLFFALRGDRTDGHLFAAEAVSRGSPAVVVENEEAAGELKRLEAPFFRVRSSLGALQNLARVYRERLRSRVVAVTGSSGKTTTKEFIRAILGKRYVVHSNPGNFNNHIGVPLTVLGTDQQSDYLVSEIGANHEGEIDFLARILKPDIGVITNVGDAHIGYFGNRRKVAEAKAELLDNMDDSSHAVLPGGDEFLDLLRRKAKGSVVTFGLAQGCTYRIEGVREEGGGMVFSLNGERMSIRIVGTYNVFNAGAAFAVGALSGVESSASREALLELECLPGRGRVHRRGGVVLIDESYNANPTSMKGALETLVSLGSRRKIAVLGDMKELGEFTERYHRDLGASLALLGVDEVFWLGEYGHFVSEGLEKRGVRSGLSSFSDGEELLSEVEKRLRPGVAVLIKGSRVCRLEEIVERLLAKIERGD